MKLNTIDGASLMSQPLHPPNFVVDTLLSQGLHILAGSPKVGKSWLALWLAVTVRDATTTHQHGDRKALRREREKKIALGHKEDDHEEEPTWQQTMS